jgi:fluoroacetyl-CoA thioesterase
MAKPLEFEPDLHARIVRHVTQRTLADQEGNPTKAHVLSTPTLVAWFESAVSQAMLPFVSKTEVILGAHIEIFHKRPTPLGHDVAIEARLMRQEGNKTTWQVVAHDEIELVAEGTVVSAVVELATLNQRLQPKRKPFFSDEPTP